MPSQIDTAWTLPLKQTTQNKRAKRTGVPFRASHELIGFDGSLEGGLRPFQGFKSVVDLIYGFGLAAHAGGDIRAFFPFECNVENTGFAYGFVYRVEGVGGNAGRVQYRIVFRIDGDDVWRFDALTSGFRDGVVVSFFDTGIMPTEDFNDEPMDLVTVGRFNYVFRKGFDPFMFYFTCENERVESSSGAAGSGTDSCAPQEFKLNVFTDLGPGTQPNWQQGSPHTCQVSEHTPHTVLSSGGEFVTHPDMVEVITEMAVPTIVAEARVLFFGFSALEFVDATSGVGQQDTTNPRLKVRNPHVDTTHALDKSHPLSLLTELVDENNVQLWAVPPYTDPEYTTSVLIGVYNPSNFVEGSIRGYPSADMVGMIWAYRLWDSRTGRFSSLSPSKVIEPDFFGVVPDVLIGDTGATLKLPATFPMFQIIYDSAKYDTLLLFRGTPAGDLDPDQTVLSLETQALLATYDIDNFPAGAGTYKVAGYFPTLSNDALALQPKFDESLTFLENMPKAGAAMHFEGSMLVSNFGINDVEDAGLSLVRWSSLYQISVELFDPVAKYQLLTPTDDVTRFVRAGPNVWGLSKLSHYLFRKETTYMKVFPMHAGYGIVGPRAATMVGSVIYIVTEFGVKTIKPAGELSDISVANSIVVNEWAGKLDNVEMAFDAQMGLIVMLNPDLEETWLAWLNTSMTTSLHDTFFRHVTEGLVPRDPALGVGATNPLELRAIFVSQVEVETNGLITNKWRTWVVDKGRENVGTRLLGHTGTSSRFSSTIESSSSSGVNPTVLTPDFVATREMELEGAYVYLMDGANEGAKARIRYVVTSILGEGTIGDLVLDSSLADQPGDRIGISPVYCRWVGHQLGLQSGEDIQQFSFGNDDDFRVRQPEELGCHFVDVAGAAATDEVNKDARFKGLIYRGNELTPLGEGFPQSISGKTDAERKFLSIVDGPSMVYAGFGDDFGVLGAATFPSVEVVCPDLDFTLLSVRVNGKITADDREDRPHVT